MKERYVNGRVNGFSLIHSSIRRAYSYRPFKPVQVISIVEDAIKIR